MYKKYFRKKDPNCKTSEIEWIEMTGREFYQFVNSQEGRGRYFINMDDVVLEGTRSLARSYRSEKNHNDYLKRQGEGRTILSIYTVGNKYGYCGEEIAKDETIFFFVLIKRGTLMPERRTPMDIRKPIHLDIVLDTKNKVCYTDRKDISMERVKNDKYLFHLPRENTDTIAETIEMTAFFAVWFANLRHAYANASNMVKGSMQ